jgi:hypothetical protein
MWLTTLAITTLVMEIDPTLGLPTIWLTGGGMGGMVAGLYWGLYTDRLITGNRWKESKEETKENRSTIRELLSQNGDLIRERDAAVKALDALRQVAEGQRE